MEILYVLLGLAVGAALGWFIAQSRSAVLGERARLATEQLAKTEAELISRRTRATELETENGALKSDQAKTLESFKALSADALSKNTDDFLKLARESFANLQKESAGELDKRQLAIDTLLNPLKLQLIEFRARIDTVYKTESDDRTTLKAQIEQLRQLNVRITDEAHSLTQALKGQSQVRGAWGELILEHLLESADLKKGRDYLVQETITTEDGRRLRPDVILRLPDQRHLVIDSKLSLVAYERTVNASTEEERDTASAEHVRAVRTHVEELSSKRYEDTGKLITPDYVLMFVPLESAFITALKADQALYQWAFDRRVILCTAPTLLVTLKTVAGLWKQDRQTKNVQEIARRGGLLYDKFAGLYSDFETIGVHLSKARESYDEVLGKLKTGRGNLLSQVEELKTLGAKAQKSLPAADTLEG